LRYDIWMSYGLYDGGVIIYAGSPWITRQENVVVKDTMWNGDMMVFVSSALPENQKDSMLLLVEEEMKIVNKSLEYDFMLEEEYENHPFHHLTDD